jgi:predicted NAD/FAD-binding protein
MVGDVLRFYREARGFLERPDPKVSLGAWLDGRRFGRELIDDHLLPMSAAIWSAAPGEVLAFPALTLLRFFENHGLLSLRDRPRWRVVEGGSARYVEALVAPFRQRIRLGSPVREVRRRGPGVELCIRGGERLRFDQAVLAVPGDQALAILADATPAERAVLGALRTQRNEVVLHTDARLLPRRRRAWASWNYHRPADPAASPSVTYHMNRLQGLDAPEALCVTLNGAERIDPARVLARFRTTHPLLDQAAVEAQARWAQVSGARGVHFCGAYWGYGFHEDGVQSALRVGARFGLSL